MMGKQNINENDMSNFIFSSNKGKDTSSRSTYSGTHSGLKTNPNMKSDGRRDITMNTITSRRNAQQAQENSTSKFNSGWVLVEAYLMYDNLQLLSDAIWITAEIMATVSPLKLKPINILPPNYAVMGPVSKSILNSYKRGKTFRYSLSAAGSDRNSNVPKILIMTISNINTTGTKKIETPYWK